MEEGTYGKITGKGEWVRGGLLERGKGLGGLLDGGMNRKVTGRGNVWEDYWKGRMDRMVVRRKGCWKGDCMGELLERKMGCKDTGKRIHQRVTGNGCGVEE